MFFEDDPRPLACALCSRSRAEPALVRSGGGRTRRGGSGARSGRETRPAVTDAIAGKRTSRTSPSRRTAGV